MRRLLLKELLPAIGAARYDVENALLRMEFVSRFEKTEPGIARRYSKDNALELGFIFAFVKAGVPLSSAVTMAATNMRALKGGGFRTWWIFDAGQYQSATGTNHLDYNAVAERLQRATPPVLSIVSTGAVVERVEALFADHQATTDAKAEAVG